MCHRSTSNIFFPKSSTACHHDVFPQQYFVVPTRSCNGPAANAETMQQYCYVGFVSILFRRDRLSINMYNYRARYDRHFCIVCVNYFIIPRNRFVYETRSWMYNKRICHQIQIVGSRCRYAIYTNRVQLELKTFISSCSHPGP
jgi:hypothetical protein